MVNFSENDLVITESGNFSRIQEPSYLYPNDSWQLLETSSKKDFHRQENLIKIDDPIYVEFNDNYEIRHFVDYAEDRGFVLSGGYPQLNRIKASPSENLLTNYTGEANIRFSNVQQWKVWLNENVKQWSI